MTLEVLKVWSSVWTRILVRIVLWLSSDRKCLASGNYSLRLLQIGDSRDGVVFSHEPRSLEFIYQNARNYFLKEIGFKWAHHDSRKTTRVDGPCFWSRILFHYYGKGWQKIYLYRLWLR